MIDYKPITTENFSDFLHLIVNKRGGAEESFYRWKYINSPIQTFPWGFIAYNNGLPCGCIGCLSKIYVDDKGKQHPATWFADWYVDPEFRGHRIGLTLLERIIVLTPYSFGITNPKSAQLIAKKAGYNIIPNCILSKGKLRPVLVKSTRFQNKIKLYVKDVINSYSVRPLKGLPVKAIKITSGKEVFDFFSGLGTNNSFIKDAAYFDWLLRMPGVNSREWYICSVTGNRFLVSTDIEEHNKIQLRVFLSSFDIKTNEQYFTYLRIVGTVADYLGATSFESYDIVPDFKMTFRVGTLASAQPMQCNANLKSDALKALSIADKESSWLKIEIKPQ